MIRRGFHLVSAMLLLCLLSVCSSSSAGQNQSGNPLASGIVYGLSQTLPLIPAVLASHSIRIMIAKTPEQRSYGLMFRQKLADDEGMLFCYESPVMMVFWMKNTIIPLDLVLFDANLRISEIIRGMKPGIGIPDDALPRYSAEYPAQYALEIASGCADAWKLKPGDRLEVPLPLLSAD